MNLFCLILFLSVTALWFFTNEYGTLMGVYEPTCAIPRRTLGWIVSAGLLLALWHCGKGAGDVGKVLHESTTGTLACLDIVFMTLSVLIVLTVMSFFRIRGSAGWAILGSLSAFNIMTGEGFHPGWSHALSFIAAPVMSFALSALILKIFKLIFSKVRMHMITISYYMRLLVIISIILTIYTLGLNWGGLLFGIGNMINGDNVHVVSVLAVIGIIMFIFLHLGKPQSDEPSGIFADFSIYTVLSVGFSVAAVLMYFSFDVSTSLIGLYPVPLPVASIVFSAIAGAEVAQKSRLIDNSEYVKEVIAFIAAPGCSLVLTYITLHMTAGDATDHTMDFVVIGIAVVVLIALAFAGYARRQIRQKEATERLVYAQQQQIYENSRALNDMELKVVLSENQALHNAIEMKRQEVMNVALSIVEQREYLESLNSIVKQLSMTSDGREKDRLISELGASLKQRLSYDRDVDSQYFYAQAESLHEDFNAKLSENFPLLTTQERRLATLLRLGFSSKYIATLMNITPKSVEISRYRLRQKLGLSKGDNLVNYIKSI